MRIVEAIVGDQSSVLNVSNPVRSADGTDALGGVWLGMPRTVGRSGIMLSLSLDLSTEERDALGQSAAVLHAAWESID